METLDCTVRVVFFFLIRIGLPSSYVRTLLLLNSILCVPMKDSYLLKASNFLKLILFHIFEVNNMVS